VVVSRGKKRRELSGGDPETTNNRMEIIAAVEGLRALESPHQVQLFTDSEYLRKGVTSWLPGWRANGWKTAGKKPVKNQDLWQSLERELELHRVSWHWVKGHAGDRWNERADKLASAAIPKAPLPVDDPAAVHLFTSVAFSGKRGVGGWAVLLRFGDRDKELEGRAFDTSANRLHIGAAIAGLRELKRKVRVHLYTTSDYLRDGATSWLAGWKSRGWRTREGRPVAHADLWRQLDGLLRRHRVEWHVVDRDRRPEEMQRTKAMAREQLSE
jgi:ribonuclease HI